MPVVAKLCLTQMNHERDSRWDRRRAHGGAPARRRPWWILVPRAQV